MLINYCLHVVNLFMSEINSLICNQLLYGILLLRFYWMVLAGMLKLWADIKCTF